MPSDDLDKRLAIAEQRLDSFGKFEQRFEKQLNEIHQVLYKDGLSSKVDQLWLLRTKIEKRIYSVIITVLFLVFGVLATAYFNRPNVDDRLSRIEMKIEALKE